jgi:hypothetical protein
MRVDRFLVVASGAILTILSFGGAITASAQQTTGDILGTVTDPTGAVVPGATVTAEDLGTYMYFKDEPLYPFGYGLSYTTFAYSNLRLSATKINKDGTITATADVTNAGSRDGDEVVQLYLQHENSLVERPRLELKGFRRIHLAAGQKTTVKVRNSLACPGLLEYRASRLGG